MWLGVVVFRVSSYPPELSLSQIDGGELGHTSGFGQVAVSREDYGRRIFNRIKDLDHASSWQSGVAIGTRYLGDNR